MENSVEDGGGGGSETTKIDREHERILREIETTDPAFIGASLRAVYEGNNHEKFLHHLDNRIKQHDKDIEKMCNFHYQGFIESITELINVKENAQKLKNQTQVINKELQESGKEVIMRGDLLIQCRTQQKNVACAVEKLSLCLPVLEMYQKVEEQMTAERYYSALKTLEQLEHLHLPRIHQYRFCEIMKAGIPAIRNQIKDIAMSELNSFLESVRKNSDQIGRIAMKQMEMEKKFKGGGITEHLKQTRGSTISEATSPIDEILDASTNGGFDSILSHTESPQDYGNPFGEEEESLNPFATEEDQEEEDEDSFLDGEDLSTSNIINFSPVYKCLHIYGLVGARNVVESYYRMQRKKQARLVLDPPSYAGMNTTENYEQFFHQIVGFFVVEDHVLHTTQQLVNRQFLDEQWEVTLSKLMVALSPESMNIADSSVMMKVKNLIVTFADTMKAYGFPVDRLFHLLMKLRDNYGGILLKHWSLRFKNIFDEDNYTRITLENRKQEKDLLKSFSYLEIFTPQQLEDYNHQQQFPNKQLPFSLFVPRIYEEIRQFILACLQYCQDLHLSSTEVDDMIRKSTNSLLAKTLAFELQLLVAKPQFGLTELVQIITNTSFLEQVCPLIEKFVQSVTGVCTDHAHSAKLVSVSTFKDARNEAEAQIYHKLNAKIDDFFELAEYNWDVKEPRGTASHYLLDLIAFLKHNFKVFTTLPTNVAQTACMSACRHISNTLMEIIKDEDIRVITMAALQQYNLDVMQCELFSNSKPVPGFKDGVLQMSFVEIRQLLDLFLSWDWSSYFADYGSSMSRYLRVQPSTALSLLEKIKEERGNRNIFTSLSKQEREKKKLLETVVRQLRGMVSEQQGVGRA